MNNIASGQILYEGTLPRIEKPFTLVMQTAEAIPDIVTLQQATHNSLPEKLKKSLLLRTEDYFLKHVKPPHTVLGVLCDDQLIAQCTLVMPTREDPMHGMRAMDMSRYKPDQISILQAVCAHPAYRGNGLMRIMIDHWLALGRADGRHTFMASTSIRDGSSYKNLIRAGFSIQSEGIDPRDGAPIYNMVIQNIANEAAWPGS